MPLYINEATVRSLISMEEAIQAVEKVLRLQEKEDTVNFVRRRYSSGTDATLHVMPGFVGGYEIMGTKVYATTAVSNSFVVLLFSNTGTLLAVLEAEYLSQLRTGAISGIASQLLAPKNSRHFVLFGVGLQAEAQLEATLLAIPSLNRVTLTSRSQKNGCDFIRRMEEKFPHIYFSFFPLDSIPPVVASADIITTVTRAREPVLLGDWIHAATHINAVGSNHPQRVELDATAIQKCDRIVVDDLEVAAAESGDLIAAVASNVISWDRVMPLSSILTGTDSGRKTEDEVTLFESQGMAILDLALSYEILKKAEKISGSF